jgi:CIC family chloride channel protein
VTDDASENEPVTEIGDPQSALYPATYRMVVYAVVVGLIGAGAALLFDFLVELGQSFLLVSISGYRPPAGGILDPRVIFPPGWNRLFFPVVTTLGGLLSGIIVFSLAPETEGHGTDGAIRAYHQTAGTIRKRVPPVKAIASAIIIGSGGVAGREGPTAQMSVGLGAILGRWLGIRGQQRRILLLAAMSAGLSAVFRAPLGMAIFGVEILYSGMVFESEALIYTVVSAVTAYAAHGFFVGWAPLFQIPGGLTFQHPASLLGFAFLGLMAGVYGALLPNIFYGVRDLFAKIPGPPHLKPALGGLLVGCLAIAYPEILGTGYGWVELTLAGRLSFTTLLVLLLLKAPAMSLTVGSGGSGGIFGPTVAIGAMLGGVVGSVFQSLVPSWGLSTASFVLVGMAAVFAGAGRVPISTLIMVVEMTGGYGLIVPAMLANVLSFVVQHSVSARLPYQSLYESQLPTREDSPVHRGLLLRRVLRMIEGGEVSEDVTLPKLISFLSLGKPIPIGDGHEMLASIPISPGAALAGQTVAAGIGSIQGVTAIAVFRNGKMLIPRGPTELKAGDQLIVATQPAAHEIIKERAGVN